MPVKTKDGWKTSAQVNRQAQVWMKTRTPMMERIGLKVLADDAAVMQRATDIFYEIDTDKNETIDASELQAALEKMGIKASIKEATRMLTEADEDGDERVDMDEFKALIREEVKRFMSVKSSRSCVIS